MRLVLTFQEDSGARRDLLVLADPGATIGELAAALGGVPSRRPPTLRHLAPGALAWEVLPARLPLDRIRAGACVALAPPGDAGGPARVAVDVVGDAPRRYALPAGAWLIGRDEGCDIVIADRTVSARHARLLVDGECELRDLGSANGVRLDERNCPRLVIREPVEVLLGTTRVAIRPLGDPEPPGSVGVVPIIRQRVPVVEPEEVRFVAPSPPEEPEREPLPWLGILAPLLLSIVLAVALDRPSAMLLALATPLLLVGGLVSRRLSRRRTRRSELARYDARVAELEAELAEASRRERATRAASAPRVGELLRATADLGPLLWSRRPDAPGFLRLRIGTARLPSRIRLELPAAPPARLTALRDDFERLSGLPLLGDLAASGGIGLAGDRGELGPILDALLAQLAVLHAPGELLLTAIVGEAWAARLDWLKWLPQTVPEPTILGAAPALAADRDDGELLVGALLRLAELRRDGRSPRAPAIAVVLDAAAPVGLTERLALCELGRSQAIHPIWVTAAGGEVPAACGPVLLVGAGARVDPRDGGPVVEVEPETIGAAAARELALRLAPLVDAGRRDVRGAGVPERVTLAEVLGPELLDSPGKVLARWGEQPSAGPRGLGAIVGVGADGPVRIDLREHGPHALVAGTTGAGKSEFLRSWVLALASEHSPSRLNLLFIDYKGGAAFADTVRLPHCVGLVTDLGPRLARRVLTSLRAELRRREQHFARLGASELVELEARGQAPPALVVMVDEFATLAHEVPEFLDGMLDLAQRGRALGIHLVLATQRPAGVVRDGIKANTPLRIGLRMAEAADSVDVLGAPDAARIESSCPGRAFLRSGPGPLHMLQSAYSSDRTPVGPQPPRILVAPLAFGRVRPAPARPVPRAETDDRARLVTTIAAAADRLGHAPPRRPWLDELPHVIDLGALPAGPPEAGIAFGVSDAPEEQRQPVVRFVPARDGHLLVTGPSGAGKSLLLRTVAISAARTGAVEIHGIDAAGGALGGLERLPQVGSIVPGDDLERVQRLLRRLAGELGARIGGREGERPLTLLLVDGFPGWREEWEARPGRAPAYESFRELLALGRAVGMHVALSADRLAAVPSGIVAATQCRIQLGGPEGTPERWPPGRGIVDGLETQVACLGGAGEREPAAIAALASELCGSVPSVPPVLALPTRLRAESLPAWDGDRLVVGLGGDDPGPLAIRPRGVLLVAGPPGSGRTNALRWLEHALRHARDPVPVVRFASDGDADEVREVLARLLAGEWATGAAPALMIESVSRYLGTGLELRLVELTREWPRRGGLLVVEDELSAWSGAGALLHELRSPRRGLVLDPGTDGDALFRMSLPRPFRAGAPGRGVLVDGGRASVIQVPHMGAEAGLIPVADRAAASAASR